MKNTSKTKVNTLQTKRFVIRKSLIGKNTVIVFTNHKGEECKYNHDVVYNQLKDKFESMNCFQKYSSYTNSKNLPKFVRELKSIV
jgi:hypothetical protein